MVATCESMMIEWCKCGHGKTWHIDGANRPCVCMWGVTSPPPGECECLAFDLETDLATIERFVREDKPLLLELREEPTQVVMKFTPGKEGDGGDVDLYAIPTIVQSGAPLEGYKHGVIRFNVGDKVVLELGQDSMTIQGREVKDDEVLEGLRAFVQACLRTAVCS
jgi:hypothetical protein